MGIEDIIKWCQDNNQIEWLKEEANQKREYKVYPRKKVDGKSVADKSQEPQIVLRPISFIQIKSDFIEKFMPELAPQKKNKKPTMYDLINAL